MNETSPVLLLLHVVYKSSLRLFLSSLAPNKIRQNHRPYILPLKYEEAERVVRDCHQRERHSLQVSVNVNGWLQRLGKMKYSIRQDWS